ncbi:MAG: ATPase [Propionibacteriaceae bacterium]|jgi:sugar (pentulose or hexulose) kinase|nr:ATPase [Propionibacteriaceae bacterium]
MTDDVFLGIELGSTRVKAVLIDSSMRVVADGSHTWENQLVDGYWTYSLDAVWSALREAYADVAAHAQEALGHPLTTVAGIGVSAMMHGYLAFDENDELLTPFRTWRNTSTGQASDELTKALGFAIPQRWSLAHLYQAVLDEEPHVPRVRTLTTLAGYVHWRLTGRKVLGVGDASGMFPIDSSTRDFDAAKLDVLAGLLADHGVAWDVRSILPTVLKAGDDAGTLTADGAAALDPSGRLAAGVPLAPPEGDAGTGMVATNAVAPRTGNISAGTSIFAMVVLEHSLAHLHPEIDMVTTPAGDAVAMVHCNNGASELDAWAKAFADFASRIGATVSSTQVFAALFNAALEGPSDGGGLVAYNYLAGEPITGLEEGRPLIVRTPDSELTLSSVMRTLIMSAFGTLALGMRTLAEESVAVDSMFAHGGIFATKGVAQRLLAAALDTRVSVGQTASEGGAWGMAVLTAYAVDSGGASLTDYLAGRVFADAAITTVEPDPADVAGFSQFLARYEAGLAIERAAVATV